MDNCVLQLSTQHSDSMQPDLAEPSAFRERIMAKQDHVARRTTGVVKTNEPTGTSASTRCALDDSMARESARAETICDLAYSPPHRAGWSLFASPARLSHCVTRDQGRRRYLLPQVSSARPRAGGKVLAVVSPNSKRSSRSGEYLPFAKRAAFGRPFYCPCRRAKLRAIPNDTSPLIRRPRSFGECHAQSMALAADRRHYV